MKKQMVIKWVDGYEGRSDIIYTVDAEGMTRLGEDLVMNCEEDDLPKLELEMFSPEQIAEAERIGAEMA